VDLLRADREIGVPRDVEEFKGCPYGAASGSISVRAFSMKPALLESSNIHVSHGQAGGIGLART
jgi:hypothetical protein